MLLQKWLSDEILVWRVVASAMILTVIGGAWDVWWHIMVGRQTFFEPPHIMIYGGVTVSCAVGFIAWWMRGERIWRRVALALVAIPFVVAPFDELWHRIFGFEDLRSVWIIWSPPHVALDLSFAFVLILLLPFLWRESEELRIFFGSVIFATLLMLFLFLVIPFNPEDQFHLLGWWGAIGASCVHVAVMLYGKRYLKGSVTALSIATALAVYVAIHAEVGVRSPDILMNPHFDFPSWLYIFAQFVVALVLDLLIVLPEWLRGTVAGALWGTLLYGTGVFFIPSEFVYAAASVSMAVIGAAVGGLLGALAASKLPQPK